MVSPQQVDIVRVLELVAEEQSDHLDAEAPSIHVVPQEEHLPGLRRSVSVEKVN